jgi:WD40 repeat protein
MHSDDLPEMKKRPEAKRVNDVLQFWDLKNHKLIKYQEFTDQHINAIALSPDGNYLVAWVEQSPRMGKYSKQYLYVWDAQSMKVLKRILISDSTVWESRPYGVGLKFSPQGHLLAINFMVEIQLIDAFSWKSKELQMVTFWNQEGMLQNRDEAFSSDGKKVAAASCNLNTESQTAWTLTIWNAKTGKVQLYLNDSKFVLDPQDDFTCLDVPISFLGDDHTIAAGSYILDIRNLKRGATKLISAQDLSKLDSTKFQNVGMYVNKNKQLALLACWDKKSKLVLWDLKSKKALHTWTGSLAKHEPYDSPTNIVFSPDGNQVAFNEVLDSAINSNVLQVWDIP